MICFDLSPEQQMIRRMVREFVDQEVKPLAARIDRDRQIPPALVNRARELGLFGIGFPEAYGGAGAGEVGYCLMSEELGHGCGSLAGLIGAHASIAAASIHLGGTEDQKKEYLTPMAKGEMIGAYALSEPGAGTDAAAIRTTAVRDGDHYVINGQKIWITNADIADVMIVYAVTDPALRAHGGITAFIVERSTPGIRVGAIDEKMGLRAMHSPEVFFDDCRVPARNILGGLGLGFKLAMQALDVGRLSLGATCVGAAKEMLDLSIAYAGQRHTFGKPIGEHQAIQFMLAEMATMIYAMESMVYRTAADHDAGRKISRPSAEVKWYCTESLGRIIDMALQIHGGMGYMCELPIERFYRDARVNRIFEGTNEIQRVVIARELLKQGRY
jgi:alkylation response protein AidB-like acyl-CoA dehydrogenase